MKMFPTHAPSKRARAFTLIELLVVMTIVLLLAGLLLPVTRSALHKARVTQSMNAGKGLYQVLFARQLEDTDVLPRSRGPRAYINSTDYFRDLVKAELLDVDFAYFTANGVEICKESEPEQFRPYHNAWCITADVTDRQGNLLPLLFTRNLGIQTLEDPPETYLTDEAPFGKKHVVVVNFGGAATSLEKDDLKERFNPKKYTNAVLRPGDEEPVE